VASGKGECKNRLRTYGTEYSDNYVVGKLKEGIKRGN
jgi:hypothetical protein